MRTYSAISVAKRFLELAQTDKEHVADISNMKLQKLCFFAHSISLLSDNAVPLISDTFKAWDYGPVEPKLYNRLSRIRKRTGSLLFTLDNPTTAEMLADVESVEDTDAQAVIDTTWGRLKMLSSVELSDISHRPGSPWSYVYAVDKYGDITDNIILAKRFGGVA